MCGVPFSIMILSREQLLADLYQAYREARRHKGKKPYIRRFEKFLENNLTDLCNELFERRYKARPSECFLITDPKKREVFAADFRDRIVHHLYYNYVHEVFERTFIQDSYSCIKGRGTHYGINRMEQHIRRESRNWQEPCWVLKMDIRGYFMHINRQRLLEITLRILERKGSSFDLDFLRYLTREIVLLDPIADCRVKGNPSEWNALPRDKSLFHSPEGYGLPIGNLTSQLFSNVYLGRLDVFMKRTLHCRRYGRYVDDFYVVSVSRKWLHTLIPQVRKFLKDELDLTLHEGKVRISSVNQGVEFLGAYLKPHRRYVSTTTLRRMQRKLSSLALETDAERLQSRIASFRGVLSHYKTGWLSGKAAFRSIQRPFLSSML